MPTSGTTPPKRACSSACEETIDDEHAPVVGDDGGCGLVAGRLDAEDHDARSDDAGSRHMISASSRLSV